MAQNERVEFESTKTFFYDYDDFIMIFYGFIRSISDLKSVKAFQVLTELTHFTNYDTGQVILTPKRRGEICKTLGITKNNLSTYLKALVESNLIHGDQSDYTINPQIFWKGDPDKRRKILKNREFYVEFGFRKPSDNNEELSFNSPL